jgi:hypothetical protein
LASNGWKKTPTNTAQWSDDGKLWAVDESDCGSDAQLDAAGYDPTVPSGRWTKTGKEAPKKGSFFYPLVYPPSLPHIFSKYVHNTPSTYLGQFDTN